MLYHAIKLLHPSFHIKLYLRRVVKYHINQILFNCVNS